jgi:oligopeptide/dipeptide ABC transporter ATP-binding protein
VQAFFGFRPLPSPDAEVTSTPSGIIVANNSREKLAQIRDLAITYAREGEQPIHALDAVSLDIEPAEVVGVLGESGSGKSTLGLALLRLLPAYARYDNGSILFRGQDLLQLSEPDLHKLRGQEISLIPQDPALSLNPVIKVGKQIAEVIRAHSTITPKARKYRAIEFLAEVGFDVPHEIYHAYPHQLSGGQGQRIAIAQAVACRPALVVADEPTSKLDASLQADIISLLSKIQARHRMAFLVITHDPTILPGFADRVVVMYAGRIVEEAPANDTFRRPLHPYTHALVRLSERFVASNRENVGPLLPGIEGASPDLTHMARGCRFEPRCAERMEVCISREPHETKPESSRRVSCFKYGN